MSEQGETVRCISCSKNWRITNDQRGLTEVICVHCKTRQQYADAKKFADEEQRAKKPTCTFHIKDDHICEEIQDAGVVRFVKWLRPSTKCRFEIVDECCGYVPRIDKVLTEKMVRLPGRPMECSSIVDIIHRITEIAERVLDTRDPETLQLQIRLCLTSWFLDPFYRSPKLLEKVAPLITVEGGSGTGKKRWYTLMRSFSYRPVHILKGNTVPSIVRTVEPWNASLFVNEADMANSDSENELIQLYNGRYDGEPIPKYNAETKEVDVFKSFGLTALALRRQPRDEGIVSRRINLESVEAQKDVPEIVDEEFFNMTQSIQNEMLYLRLKYFDAIKFSNRSGLAIEDNWRVKEVLVVYKVLGQIDPDALQDLKTLSARMTKKQVRDNANTWDGAVLNIVYSFVIDETAIFRPFRGGGVVGLKMKEKTDEEGAPDEEEVPLTAKFIADQLKTSSTEITKALRPHKVEIQFERVNGKSKRILVFTDPKYLCRMFRKYVVDFDMSKMESMLKQQLDFAYMNSQQTGLSINDTIEEEEKERGDTKGSVTSVTSVTKSGENEESVTDVTLVTHGRVSGPPSNKNNNEHATNSPESVILGILRSARGEFIEQSPAHISTALRAYNLDIPSMSVEEICNRLASAGKLRLRNKKFSASGTEAST